LKQEIRLKTFGLFREPHEDPNGKTRAYSGRSGGRETIPNESEPEIDRTYCHDYRAPMGRWLPALQNKSKTYQSTALEKQDSLKKA